MTDFENVCSVQKLLTLLIDEIVRLRIEQSCVRLLQFTQVEIPGLYDASSTNLNLSVLVDQLIIQWREWLTSHHKHCLRNYYNLQIELWGKAKTASVIRFWWSLTASVSMNKNDLWQLVGGVCHTAVCHTVFYQELSYLGSYTRATWQHLQEWVSSPSRK